MAGSETGFEHEMNVALMSNAESCWRGDFAAFGL